MDPFLLNAWLAGIGIVLMSAPLGCFVAWQRLVYVGDSIAHASVLGVVLALLCGTYPLVGMVLVAAMIALVVASLQDDSLLPSDTLLGIVAHGSLALGLVLVAISPSITFDINGLLFGDILAVGVYDLLTIFATATFTLTLLTWQWKPLMRFVLHADIAQVEGINTKRLRLLIMFLIAMMVAISIKLVGILLITSLLILPAASARLLAKSPSHMAIYAAFIGIIAVTLGLNASLHFDTPSGPSIILAALAILAILAVNRIRTYE